MSTKCLVTKLQGAVDNQDLPYVGEFKMYFYSNSNNANLNDFAITSSTEINWESTVNLYDKVQSANNR
jgi:hypothetical protein